MILISGATGRVGGAASQALTQAGVPHRVLVRDPARFAPKDANHVEVLTGNLENADDVQQAMQGVTRALLVTSNNPTQPAIEKRFAEAAAQAGVAHLVKISSLEAGPKATAAFPVQHYHSEQLIQSLGLTYTFLRPNFFMQNLLMYAGAISGAGMFPLPLGDARTALVDTRDVGAAAAAVLTQPGHNNKIYALSGPQLMTFDEVAAVMSEVLDKPIRYMRQTPEEFRAALSQFVKAKWQLDGVCELFAEIASGSLDSRTEDLSTLLGREPTTAAQFVRDHAKAFS